MNLCAYCVQPEPSTLYIVKIPVPLGLVAVSVTFTRETYQPFMPAAPVTCNNVTGGPNEEPLIRTTELFAVSTLLATPVAWNSMVWVPFPLTGKTLVWERHAPPSTRYSEAWIPLVASVAARVTSTEELDDP